MQTLRQPRQAALAIEADVGATNTRTSLPAFNAMLEILETAYTQTHVRFNNTQGFWRVESFNEP